MNTEHMEAFPETADVSYRYIVGIDLGTTNSALAFIDRSRPDDEQQRIHFFDVAQLVSLGEVGRRSILPSFLYLPGPYELPPESTALPWDPKRDHVVGEFAREQGALVPGRLVSSAKSWLCHGGVDRTASILPWGAGGDVSRVSPVDASARYLRHLKEAWNQVMARGREGYRLEEQLVILTVPASFDEVARELTVAAARDAGLPRVILVEEPLAAFYAWLSRHEADWRDGMSPGQLILVCDVGGGTTDFTLVAIREGEKGLRFDRLAVGDHLMLGGDNMDLSLARSIEGRLLGRHGQLDSKRWHQLWHQCRKAKEVLLGTSGCSDGFPPAGASRAETLEPSIRGTGDAGGAGGESTVDITIMGSGSKLIGWTLKGPLTCTEVEKIILEGFFPYVSLNEAPKGGRRTGLTEWGLPYVQDPAVTRHLASFWLRYEPLIRQETGRTSLYPDFMLFNGGALTPPSIRKRIISVVQSWFRSEAGEGWSPIELENPRPELAVAIGAAYYGTVRLGEGVRVGAGTPRAYYVEVTAPPREAGDVEGLEGLQETDDYRGREGGQTSDGLEQPEGSEGAEGLESLDESENLVRSAVCLVPRGTEEGFEARLDQPSFQLLANQPVSFQLFSSSTRLGDRLGEIVTLSEEEVTPLPTIKTVLRYGKKAGAQTIPVQLAIRLTEVGTLELWCQSQLSSHRWQLQFDVRQSGEVDTPPVESTGELVDTDLIQDAQAAIRAAFLGSRGSQRQTGSSQQTRTDRTGRLEQGGKSPVSAAVHTPERLTKNLVSILDLGKEKWATTIIRTLSDTLLECKDGRSLTHQHEARWLNLMGFCMRPGFGDPLDEWRMREIWKLYPQSLQFPRQGQSRSEWWIFWRRVAGGLSAGQQWHVYLQVLPIIQPGDKKKKKGGKALSKSLSGQEEIEIWMFLANLERLPAQAKADLGNQLLQKIRKGKPKPQELWALSRLGARVPFYGPLDQVISSDVVSSWVESLLKLEIEPSDGLARAVVQLARQTGDRERDVSQQLRDRIREWLKQVAQGERLTELLTHPDASLMGQEKDWIFGESLPVGLILTP